MQYLEIVGIPYLSKGSGIHIKKENRGKFTATKKRTGKTTEELTHSKNPLTRKRAIFAQNAKKWKHEDGGSVHKPNGHRSVLDNGWFKTKDLKKNHPLTYQQGGKSRLHADNPYLDAAIELTPLGDARDIYEGVNSGNYQQSVEGLIGLGGTLVGISILPKLIKGYKAYNQLKKANKLIKTSPFKIVRDQARNQGKAAYNTLHQMPYNRIASTAVAKGIDGINDLKSIFSK